ncbi:ferritin [Aestuariimicrobium sp. Y1814]|uniref:ferritin n=1 Tax=Aestuariimicrobium sp. Y1814 TaxID=3418742 RepID=UPI003DA6F5F1
MKMTPTLEAAFNDQVTLELGAATTYRQLAIEVDVRDLPGMAAWLRHQADEEIVHANKFIDHMVDRGMHPRIGAGEQPPANFDSVLAVFEAALAHEEKVSEAIRNLYRSAHSEGDLDSRPLLDWFLEEQIEEEATVSEIIGRLKLIGDDGSGLLRLDSELGQRQAGTTENNEG